MEKLKGEPSASVDAWPRGEISAEGDAANAKPSPAKTRNNLWSLFGSQMRNKERVSSKTLTASELEVQCMKAKLSQSVITRI